MNEIYLDNSATTKPCNACITKITEILMDKFGNPSSLHEKGLEAEKELDAVRAIIALNLNANADEVFFTSGGTEANNLAVFGGVMANKKRGSKVITTTIEHPSVFSASKELEKMGFEVVFLKPDTQGQLSLEKIEREIDENTIFVSVMMVNNEVGTIFPVEKLKKIIIQKKSPALLHIDAVQAFGKIPIDVRKLDVDLLTISAHKVHGPKGVGALFKRKNLNILPRTFGGEQQQKLRPGTEAVPLIAGFGAAVRQFSLSEHLEKINQLNQYFKEKISQIGEVTINSPQNAIPYVINISTNEIKSETMLHFLSSKGIFVSSGSACAKAKKSRVLSEMRLSAKQIDTALRISFSYENTFDDIDEFLHQLKFGIENLMHI